MVQKSTVYNTLQRTETSSVATTHSLYCSHHGVKSVPPLQWLICEELFETLVAFRLRNYTVKVSISYLFISSIRKRFLLLGEASTVTLHISPGCKMEHHHPRLNASQKQNQRLLLLILLLFKLITQTSLILLVKSNEIKFTGLNNSTCAPKPLTWEKWVG